MSNIINFPNSDEREWRQLVNDLRESYKNLPMGLAAVEECLPDIRAHWEKIFVSFSIQPNYQVPPSTSKEQFAAIQTAVQAGVNLMIERLQHERAQHFAMLVCSEFKAAYYKLNM
jgi:hypothetical protein